MSRLSEQLSVLGAAAVMAANHARVQHSATALSDQIDGLVAATVRRDWGEVGRLGAHLATASRVGGYRAVSALAQKVCDEAGTPQNEVGVKRSLIRLIGTYGRTGRRHRIEPGDR